MNSKMNFVSPSSTFGTGVAQEVQSFRWIIGNFHLIRQSKSMIESQKFDFTAGETTGHPSHWTVFLTEKLEDGKRWIRIDLKLKSPKPTAAIFKDTSSGIRFVILDNRGRTLKDNDTGPLHIPTRFLQFPSWGFDYFINAADPNIAFQNLVILINFTLYTPFHPKSTFLVETITELFQDLFVDQLRKDFKGLLKTTDPCAEIKLISNDQKEFTAQRGILAVRSEVFAAMLSCNMIEANTGVIQLPDMSSNALEVLLNFFYTGELLSKWSEPGVIVELTNAAAKYQLQDLLQFLDLTIGKVCKLENVLPLLFLARQLSLEVAEEGLMAFVRKEGIRSADNFIQMCNSGYPETFGEPPSAGNRRFEKFKSLLRRTSTWRGWNWS